MPQTKVCKTCKVEKDVSCFSKAKDSKWYHPHCKPCDAKRAREMRAANRLKGFCSCGRQKAEGDEFRCQWCREWRNRSDNERSRKNTARWYANNQPKIKKGRRDKKIKVLMAYGGLKCVCVGCDIEHLEFLTIDHINGGGRAHRRAVSGHLYDWLIKFNFPPGFRVLCMNCNFAYGKFGYCPHQQQDCDAEHARTPETIKST